MILFNTSVLVDSFIYLYVESIYVYGFYILQTLLPLRVTKETRC